MQHSDRTLFSGDIKYVGRHHHRRYEYRRRPGRGLFTVGEVTPQSIHVRVLDDTKRRRTGSGPQAAEPQHLDTVLHRHHHAVHGTRNQVATPGHRYHMSPSTLPFDHITTDTPADHTSADELSSTLRAYTTVAPGLPRRCPLTANVK